jgi:transcription antitermination protein NusB
VIDIMTANTERRAEPRPARETRHHAREAALQMLYQWEVGRVSMFEVRQTFWSHGDDDVEPLSEDLQAFATRLADGVSDGIERLDPIIADAAEHWRVERMNVMDRLILRMAVYEFVHQPETPGKVIINEALELARTFSGDESVRFINGVLDAIRRKLERE